jgi:hypothetical protein
MPSPIPRLATDLAWSLWGELGVPSVIRDHTHVVVDPEPLILAAPLIAQHDARLRDEMWRWCAAHADRISTSRLKGLARRAQPEVREAFEALAATLATSTTVRWPHPTGTAPWPRTPEPKPRTLHLDRPSLLALRARAMVGVGARADVLTTLLGRTDRWTRASELEYLGYSKRNVARVLGDLAEASLLQQRGERNSLTFRIANRAPWEHQLRTKDLVWMRWDLAFELAFALLQLEALTAKPTAVQRVEGTKLRITLNTLASSLDLSNPPEIRDREAPLDALLRWGEAMLSDLTKVPRSDPKPPSQTASS